jgi:excisionase family DNA binding protein
MEGTIMPDDLPDPLTVSLKEAGRLLGVNRTRIYRLIADGLIDARKIGRRTLITMKSIRDYASALPKAQIGVGARQARGAE